MATFGWEIIGFVVTFIYGSFFEWFFHRYMFHTPKYSKYMFRQHTLVHHQIYKDGETYRVYPPQEPERVAMDWWALPAMLAVHFPFIYGIQLLIHRPIMIGALAAIAVYFALYEGLHWVMHVPSAVEILGRFPVFRYLDRHHEIHHKYMLSNLNVILPLADFVMGTKRDENGSPQTLFPRSRSRRRNPVSSKREHMETSSLLSGKIDTEGISHAGSLFATQEDLRIEGTDTSGLGADHRGTGRQDQSEDHLSIGRSR